MTYRFDIEHRGDGSVRVTCGTYEATGERALARKLVNAGAPDGPMVAGLPDSDAYRVASLHRFAAHTLAERDTGLQIEVYKPHPRAEVSPSLERAVSASVEAAKNRREAEAARANGQEGAEGAGGGAGIAARVRPETGHIAGNATKGCVMGWREVLAMTRGWDRMRIGTEAAERAGDAFLSMPPPTASPSRASC